MSHESCACCLYRGWQRTVTCRSAGFLDWRWHGTTVWLRCQSERMFLPAGGNVQTTAIQQYLQPDSVAATRCRRSRVSVGVAVWCSQTLGRLWPNMMYMWTWSCHWCATVDVEVVLNYNSTMYYVKCGCTYMVTSFVTLFFPVWSYYTRWDRVVSELVV